MFWFNFILGLAFYFLLFQNHYHDVLPFPKPKENKNQTKEKIEQQHIHVQTKYHILVSAETVSIMSVLQTQTPGGAFTDNCKKIKKPFKDDNCINETWIGFMTWISPCFNSLNDKGQR